ncbi:hypothetical protein DV704_00960 [Meiothermus sp. QL-1]|uniref:hypothetical protein n=1 Tax=Meiothermus sp. QL-1 TaxID=2058095 RepID=UPI000E0A6300|nr:hypothetical protein [Meiothermus sp. QL-1]RDI96428.1 hypothetical protein DV704_00960 [Meiothermus sp. QL-1]
MKRFGLVLLLLAGCSNAPITVPIQDFDTDFAGVQSSQAVFAKGEFRKPPVNLSSLVLEGTLYYPQTSASFTFFVSDTEPCGNRANGFYICNPNASHIEQAGTASFQSGSPQPLRLSANRLTSGINSGNLWIGVRLDSGIATAGTLQFRNMVARVAVLP